MSPLYELLPQSKTINLGLDSDPGGYWWGSSPLGKLPALRISAGGIWAHIQILLHWILLDTLLLTELEIGVMYLTRILEYFTRIIAMPQNRVGLGMRGESRMFSHHFFARHYYFTPKHHENAPPVIIVVFTAQCSKCGS